ncbi:MAG: hypothetical protein D6696_06365, partial [Acidobacteria bacterium]
MSGGRPAAAPGRPERAAHASIRGYLYQTALGVERWLGLEEGEYLLCEGDEDLDRLLLGGGGVSEQVKALSGEVNVRDRPVIDSLRQFLLTYHALGRRGEERRFVFTTTARRRLQRTHDLKVDVLGAWHDRDKRDDVVRALKILLPSEKTRDAEALDAALAWLEAEGRWGDFLDRVEWRIGEPDLEGVRRRIAGLLARRDDTRGLPPETLTDRLLAELLEASSRAEPRDRLRGRDDLERFARTVGGELARWATTPRAVKLRELHDELAGLRHLIEDGVAELPEDPSPGKLLTAAYEVVPFDEEGRRRELDFLAGWCDDEKRRGVWLLTGEGGAGKTRLMIEWCQRLAAQGWHAGFLRR